VEIVTVSAPTGVVSPDDLAATVDDQTACVLVQHPNFFGCLEDASALADVTRDAGALFLVSADPISLGLLKRPGDYGADVVVAEGQSLGNPMLYGGPYLGILACRESLVRKAPGRLVGETVDREGRRCWVLTLQTREQHIRRQKATSNICTNQGLFALRSTIYLALMGPQGLRETAELCAQKARYAADALAATGRLTRAFAAPIFKEFVLRDVEGRPEQLLAELRKAGFHAGIPLGRFNPELADCILVAVTEQRTKAEIDRLASCVSECAASADRKRN
ncbi:MAG: glycine dehydrogenase, partial [Planctomycetales bacterium]